VLLDGELVKEVKSIHQPTFIITGTVLDRVKNEREN
jgi:hypothetical protein